MTDDNGLKWLTAARLVELLSTLPPDSRVMPNRVGNLLVLAATDDDQLAFVDFSGAGNVEAFD